MRQPIVGNMINSNLRRDITIKIIKVIIKNSLNKSKKLINKNIKKNIYRDSQNSLIIMRNNNTHNIQFEK